MKKLWKIAVIGKSDFILDLYITKIPYETNYKRKENHFNPGGGFDTVVYQVLKIEEENEFHKIIAALYKRQNNMSRDAIRTLKPFINTAANMCPEDFI